MIRQDFSSELQIWVFPNIAHPMCIVVVINLLNSFRLTEFQGSRSCAVENIPLSELGITPSKPKGSISKETGEEAGLTHLFGCTGRSPDGSPCPAWVPTWLPKQVPTDFMEHPFLCGFYAAEEVAKLTTNTAPNVEACKLFSLLQSDVNQQYASKDNSSEQKR